VKMITHPHLVPRSIMCHFTYLHHICLPCAVHHYVQRHSCPCAQVPSILELVNSNFQLFSMKIQLVLVLQGHHQASQLQNIVRKLYTTTIFVVKLKYSFTWKFIKNSYNESQQDALFLTFI
jgi:hypothetical protein